MQALLVVLATAVPVMAVNDAKTHLKMLAEGHSAGSFLAGVSSLEHRRSEEQESDDDVTDASLSTFQINPPSLKEYAPFGSAWLAGLTRPVLGWLAASNLGWPSYSQYRQDQKLLSILGQIKEGFYVESGAFDGETGSNTLLYELRGWKGLLIEPSPDVFKSLMSKNRNAFSFNGALSPTKKIEVVDFHDDPRNPQNNYAAFLEIPPTKVPAVPLATLLRKLNRKIVDFWSLDIEGTEGHVLENTDFKAIEIGVIQIEMNKNDDNNDHIKRVMSREGFHEAGVMLSGGTGQVLDRVFVNPQYFKKRGLEQPIHVGD